MSFISRVLAFTVAMTCVTGVATSVAQKKDPYLLTRAEIVGQPGLKTAYDAVRLLRPRFLRSSTTHTPLPAGTPSEAARSSEGQNNAMVEGAGILVVVDGTVRGDLRELNDIPSGSVESIRFLKADEARIAHYGPTQKGVIEVKILKETRPQEAASLGAADRIAISEVAWMSPRGSLGPTFRSTYA